jgi:hypothetical protein
LGQVTRQVDPLAHVLRRVAHDYLVCFVVSRPANCVLLCEYRNNSSIINSNLEFSLQAQNATNQQPQYYHLDQTQMRLN